MFFVCCENGTVEQQADKCTFSYSCDAYSDAATTIWSMYSLIFEVFWVSSNKLAILASINASGVPSFRSRDATSAVGDSSCPETDARQVRRHSLAASPRDIRSPLTVLENCVASSPVNSEVLFIAVFGWGGMDGWI